MPRGDDPVRELAQVVIKVIRLGKIELTAELDVPPIDVRPNHALSFPPDQARWWFLLVLKATADAHGEPNPRANR